MDIGNLLGFALQQSFGPTAIIYCLAAIGLNIHFGYTGLLNFGQAGFMLVAGYSFGGAVTIFATSLWAGVVVGIVWTAQARPLAPDNSNLQAISLLDPKVFIAMVTWGVYSFSLLARNTLGWTGRRAAWLSTAGFATVLLNLLPVSYFVTTSHTFSGP